MIPVDDFIESIYDDLNSIDEGMMKSQILAKVDSIMDSIEQEMGWENGEDE